MAKNQVAFLLLQMKTHKKLLPPLSAHAAQDRPPPTTPRTQCPLPTCSPPPPPPTVTTRPLLTDHKGEELEDVLRLGRRRIVLVLQRRRESRFRFEAWGR